MGRQFYGEGPRFVPFMALGQLEQAKATSAAAACLGPILLEVGSKELDGEILVVVDGITTAVPVSGNSRELINQLAILQPPDKELVGAAAVQTPQDS